MRRLSDSPLTWLSTLADAAPALAPQRRPLPYYSQREPGIQSRESSLIAVVRRVHALVGELEGKHYFAEFLGFDCVDYDARLSTPELELDRRIGKQRLWSAEPDDWTEPDLCDFIEVFHDLASRPTQLSWHSYNYCGWHPEAFSHRTGQALYRWEMNQLLDSSTFGLRLAEHGQDLGRMVRATGGELGQMIDEALAAESAAHDSISHAVSLYRRRGATREDCRSAIRELAAILEERRESLRRQLLKRDEQALFEIANQFDIRHRNASQYQEYGSEFLDWIFYWYLATVQLTDRRLDR